MLTLASPRSSALCRPRWATPQSNRPSYGARAVRLAEAAGFVLMPWQRQVLNVALEVDPVSRLPAYREVRVSVPRRSGKTVTLLAVQIDRSLGWRHQRSLYTAQDRANSRTKWEEQVDLLAESKLAGLFTTRRQSGLDSPHVRQWGMAADRIAQV